MERPNQTNPPSSVNQTPDRATKPYIGGADAVEKTSTLGNVHGAGPADDAPIPPHVTASVRSGRGLGPVGWILVVIAAIVLIAYAAGLFT